MDIGVTRFLDFKLDDRNDMPVVEGRRQVEQAIAVAVHDTFYNNIGNIDSGNVISLLEREAERAAGRTDYADEVAYVNGKYAEDEPNTVIMEIQYNSGELNEILQLEP